VAFTRAKDGLIVWGPFADSEKYPNDVNSYLRMAVMQTFKDFFKMPQSVDSAPNCELFTILGSVPFDKRVAFDSNSLVSAARIQTGNWREKLRFRTRSTDFFIQSIKSVRDKVNFGTLMHEALARCRKVDNSKAQESEVLASLNKLFASAHLKDWFSDKWIATVEQAILNTDGNILIPDRIIENESLAIVIDYKFGEPRPEHHDQVRVYMALYQSMNPQKIVQGKLYYATSDTVEAVV
jgi:ATP-dependent exoDNAse (exonuclease V) beta subunit